MLLGGWRMQQPTIDGSSEGDGYDSGWQRLMATARRTVARQDTMTATMATGDNDEDNDDDGDGATGDKVDDDGNDDNYGDRRRRQQWQWRNGQ